MLNKRPDFRTGDLVEWVSVVYGPRRYTVVQAWTDAEPYRLLVIPEGSEGEGKCFVALCVDCRLLQRGPEEALVFKGKALGGSYARNYGRVTKPCVHPLANDPVV